MTIERISTPFLNTLAEERWQEKMAPEAIQTISDLTENHPYYVNALCRNLWKGEAPPSPQSIQTAWQTCVQQQAPWMATDLSKLTLKQRKVLKELAFEPTSKPQGIAFTQRIGLNHASIKPCIGALLGLDMIYQDKKGRHHLLDPAVGYFIRTFSPRIQKKPS